MGFQCRMECERIYGGKLRYDGQNVWCRECQIAIMIESLITMNGFPVKRCPCCHQRVRFSRRRFTKAARILKESLLS